MAERKPMTPDEQQHFSKIDVPVAPHDTSQTEIMRLKKRLRDTQLLSLLGAMLLLATFGIAVYAAVEANRDSGAPKVSGTDFRLSDTPTLHPEDTRFSLLGDVFEHPGYWADARPMPVGVSDLQAETIDGLVYLLGGAGSDGTPLDTVTAYDPVARTYTPLAPMPTPRWRFASAVRDRKIVVMGGAPAGDGPLPRSTYEYDPVSDAWTQLGDLIQGRQDCCGAAVDGKVYVTGGNTLDFSAHLGSVEVLQGGSWSRLPGADMPTPRGDCKAAPLTDSLVTAGGYENASGFQSVVEAYNTTSGEWRTLAPLGDARGDKALVSLGGVGLLAIGGEVAHPSTPNHNQNAVHDVEEYDPVTDRWTSKAPVPVARFRAAAAYVEEEDTVVVFGGHANCPAPTNTQPFPDCSAQALASAQMFFDVRRPSLYAHVFSKGSGSD